jgi:hypothetical protein
LSYIAFGALILVLGWLRHKADRGLRWAKGGWWWSAAIGGFFIAAGLVTLIVGT